MNDSERLSARLSEPITVGEMKFLKMGQLTLDEILKEQLPAKKNNDHKAANGSLEPKLEESSPAIKLGESNQESLRFPKGFRLRKMLEPAGENIPNQPEAPADSPT